jgi:hypothetical protein
MGEGAKGADGRTAVRSDGRRGETGGGAADRTGLRKVELKVCLSPGAKRMAEDQAHGMGLTLSALVEQMIELYCRDYTMVYRGPRPGMPSLGGGDRPGGGGSGGQPVLR